ncbi:hypothetical protein BRC91_04630 [Halobacteriales archaeon QS_4_62_28]|nr:MAG: hypothetical protein BRC91_04630 [Halobacteriales archaeon QS_4_62_28]
MTVDSLTAGLQETFECFDGSGTPQTTTEVAEQLDLGRRSTYDRLERLVETGRLETKKVGASARVWWRSVRKTADSVEPSGTIDREHRHDVFDRIDDGVFGLDNDWRITYVNDRAATLLGQSRDELLGDRFDGIFPENEDMRFQREAHRARERDESLTFETHCEPLDTWFEATVYPSETGFSVYFRDVSDRQERNRQLQQRLAQLEAISELGHRALETHDLDELMADAATLVAETLGTDYCKVLDLDQSADELLLRQGVGWDDGIVGTATVSAVEDDSQAAYTLKSDEPVRVEDLTAETRFSGPALLTDHGVQSGISVIIGPPDDPWGILGTHDRDRRSFADHDVNFVRSVANVLATAINRHDHEQMLVRQRQQLSAINSLNRTVSDIASAVIDQSTRSEIEAAVCERLAASDSYEFAWIGETDPTAQEVRLRTEAGVEGYLDGRTISVDPDEEYSQGPTGQALRTGAVQTARGLRTNQRHDQWRGDIEAHGVTSSAAVPIVCEDSVYGVLNVYTQRDDAFEGQEQVVIARIGEIVGHAIAASDRKRALLSDELVELEFCIRDFFDAVGIDGQPDARIAFENIVPIDDECLVYGTSTPGVFGFLQRIVDDRSHWKSVRIIENDGEQATFELRLAQSSMISAVASLGGRIERAVIDDDFRMTVSLSADSDARPVIDAIQTLYPSAELLKRRQITREGNTEDRIERMLAEGLTDRQRTALETAYHAGFFEWPRVTAGDELAASLDVSPPTFHQHLRKAEQKLVAAVLSSPSSDA